MMDFNQQLLVTYECVNAIGISLDKQEMIEHFLRVFSKKTGAVVSAYWEKKDSYELFCGQGKKALLSKIKPKNIEDAWYTIINDDNSKSLFMKIGKGMMSFLFVQSDTSVELIESILHSLYTKLDNAIMSCDSHKKLLSLNQDLNKKIEEEVRKNREKDKHILQQSRQAQMGEMISMIAHQWRQPLSAISTVVAGLKLKEALGKYDLNTKEGQIEHKKNLGESLNKIEEYVRFLTTTIDDFRNFFKPDKKREEVYLVELVDKTLEIIGKALEVNKITVHVENQSKVKVNTYANEVMQVILNILKNAEDVFKEKKIENAYIKIRIKSEEGYEKIEIEDNAGGIPEDIIDKIFEPYFSTKQEKNGTGLGLYMSKTIIEDHCGGTISASNTGKGALFSISLKGMEND
jgi:signal transduction histidine kinase